MKKSFIIILVLVICAAIFYGVRYVKQPVDTQIVSLSKYEQSVAVNAYIVKNEMVYQAKNTGTFYSYASDGSRVGKDREIATVYNGTVSNDLLLELNNIDKKITEAYNKNKTYSVFLSDSTSTQSQIEFKKNSIIDAVQNDNVSKITEYKNDINNINCGVTPKPDDTVEKLKIQKSQIEKKFGNTKKDIISRISGIYTANIDGLENTITPESVLQYQVSDFDALVKPQNKPPKTEVKSGENVCKVIDNHVWYSMFKVEQSKMQGYDVGSMVTLHFETIPGVEVRAVIKYISKPDNGNVVVVLECRHYVEGIFTTRNADIQIILSSYTGYKVPTNTLRVEDNKTGVMVDTKGIKIFKECDILYTDKNESFSIIYPVKDAKNKLQPMDRISLGEKTSGG